MGWTLSCMKNVIIFKKWVDILYVFYTCIVSLLAVLMPKVSYVPLGMLIFKRMCVEFPAEAVYATSTLTIHSIGC